MRILIVCSANSGQISPFVKEQVASLQHAGLVCEIFPIYGKGIIGYLKNVPSYWRAIQHFKPHLIHAHSGMSALLASLQIKIPVIVTFHGSDINNPKLRKLSRIAAKRASAIITVNAAMKDNLGIQSIYVIPCGVDSELFYPADKIQQRKHLGLDLKKTYVLFASHAHNTIKNFPLAKASVHASIHPDAEIIELKNFSRQKVASLFNAVDVALLTSYSEGSPQFIKEAMACGTPVVSTNVGDVNTLLENLDGCFVTSHDVSDVAAALSKAIQYSKEQAKTKGPQKIKRLGLDNNTIAEKIISVYKNSLTKF